MSEHHTFSQESCGSVLTIDIISSDNPTQLVQDCFRICEEFEQKFSRFKSGNWLEQINAKQEVAQVLDDEAYHLITTMLELANITHGAFDPTIIRTLESYGYDKEYSFTQKDAGGPVGYKLVELGDHIITLHGGVKIEFGSIGKGYLVDVITKKLYDAGYKHFLIDFGGDMKGYGGHEVGLENPFDLEQVIGTIHLDGFAVAASNGMKRKVKDFHHLLDAHTGKPVMDIAGVYISSESCMIADLYSTAVFVLGAEKGKQLLASTGEISGLIVFADGLYRKKGDYQGQLFAG